MTYPVTDSAKLAITTGEDTETLWAEVLGPRRLRVDNAPFFAYGLSADDVVEAEPDPDHEGVFHFGRVLEKSGNRTVRVFSKEPPVVDPAFQPVLDRLADLGCAFEGFQPYLLAITVPADVQLEEVIRFLEDRGLLWEPADPRAAEEEPQR